MKNNVTKNIQQKLQQLENQEKAKILQRFFKTGPGEYGEGDVFLGIQVPVLRKLAREYQNIATATVPKLLKSPIHEQRMLALLILINKYNKGDQKEQKRIYALKDIGWEYYDGNFPIFEPDVPMEVNEWQAALRKIMGKFYRFRYMFLVGLHIFSFPGMVSLFYSLNT